jgi:hypothetical protein
MSELKAKNSLLDRLFYRINRVENSLTLGLLMSAICYLIGATSGGALIVIFALFAVIYYVRESFRARSNDKVEYTKEEFKCSLTDFAIIAGNGGFELIGCSESKFIFKSKNMYFPNHQILVTHQMEYCEVIAKKWIINALKANDLIGDRVN